MATEKSFSVEQSVTVLKRWSARDYGICPTLQRTVLHSGVVWVLFSDLTLKDGDLEGWMIRYSCNLRFPFEPSRLFVAEIGVVSRQQMCMSHL